MSPPIRLLIASLLVVATVGPVGARQAAYRTHNDRFSPPRLTTLEAWKTRAGYVREHVLA